MRWAEYWFCKSAVSAAVAKELTHAAALDKRFLPALDIFQDRSIYFLTLALRALAATS
jgi:hypothetical protein